MAPLVAIRPGHQLAHLPPLPEEPEPFRCRALLSRLPPAPSRGRTLRLYRLIGVLISQAYWNLLPLLVLSVLGAATNGSFYIAWTIAAGLMIVTGNFAMSLLVEGATSPHRLAELTRGVLVRCAIFTIPGAALLAVAARPILYIYGSAYAAHASLLLGLARAIQPFPIGLVNLHVLTGPASGPRWPCHIHPSGCWLCSY